MRTITTHDSQLAGLVRQPWALRIGLYPLLVRPSAARDLPAVARMHGRCGARSLLDRYRCGGRPPAVAALDRMLRHPHSVVAVTATGTVIALGTLTPDPAHGPACVEVGLLVEDLWQRRGVGAELVSHLAGAAQVDGHRELIVYPATAVRAAQRLMLGIGTTRMVPGADPHLHTYLSEAATLGLGSVRQRLAVG